jgi:hypothetical protein
MTLISTTIKLLNQTNCSYPPALREDFFLVQALAKLINEHVFYRDRTSS